MKRNRHYHKYSSDRSHGYGMNLYRNIKKKKIGGVCAGLADHFEIDHNVMRILFVAAFIFTNMAAFWIYIIAWIALAPKKDGDEDIQMEYDERQQCYRKKNMFRYGDSAEVRIKKAKSRLGNIMKRVENMESYVTSNRYDLDRQFENLK